MNTTEETTQSPVNTSLALNLCKHCGRAWPTINAEVGEGLIEHHVISVTGSVRRCKGSGQLYVTTEKNEPLPTYKQLSNSIGDLVGKVVLKTKKTLFVRK